MMVETINLQWLIVVTTVDNYGRLKLWEMVIIGCGIVLRVQGSVWTLSMMAKMIN
jgi:hypothetical protein